MDLIQNTKSKIQQKVGVISTVREKSVSAGIQGDPSTTLFPSVTPSEAEEHWINQGRFLAFARNDQQ